VDPLAKEIERKFLVLPAWRAKEQGEPIKQGYLCRAKERTVRVRLKGEQAYLTIKGMNHGIARLEFEYGIPVSDAEALLKLCERPLIEKTRYHEEADSLVWEIDVFHGDNDGLVVAEIELPSVDTKFVKPSWAGQEVSDDARYYNSSLSEHPYKEW
jgi:CYTH domain-containing protein